MPLSFSNNSGLQKVRGKSKIQFKFLWVKLYIQLVNKLPRYWLFFYDVACYSPGHSNKLQSVSHLNKLNKRPTPAGSTSLIEQAIVLLKIMRPKKQLILQARKMIMYFSWKNNHLLYLFTRSQSWCTTWNFWSPLKIFWRDLRSTWNNFFFPCVHLSGM